MKKNKKHRTSDVEEFTPIDKSRLDDEWVTHCKRMDFYADQLGKAKQEQDEVKSAYDVKEAEIKTKIRKRPDRYLVDAKVTEKAVEEALVALLAKTQEHTNLLEVKAKIDMLQAAMSKLEHRKAALGDLTFLWSAGYFNEPKTRNLDKEDIDRMKSRRMNRKAVKRDR